MSAPESLLSEETINLDGLYDEITNELVVEIPLVFEGKSTAYKTCIPAPTKEAAWALFLQFKGE